MMFSPPRTLDHRRRRMRLALSLVASSLLVLVPATAESQVLQGVVVDASSRSPLPATVVTLVTAAGHDVQRFFVDESGAFRFSAPGPGVYSLRAERLGAETTRLDGIEVGGGDTVAVRMSVTLRPVALDDIAVSGERRCELASDAGVHTQRVWEAARKALTAASLTDSTAVYRYDLVRYRRRLDPRSLAVLEETASTRSTWARRPIVGRPVGVLADSGFVVRDPQGDRYYAPDAGALLSDRFLETHCFSLTSGTGEAAGLVGLEFRPLRRGRIPHDIAGVLWLQRASGALRWLEYRYTSLPGQADEVRSGAIGGRVDFHGLPDGTWIVSRWFIRMPVLEERREAVVDVMRVHLAEIVEEGGRVRRALRRGSGGVAFSEAAGSVVGEVQPAAGLADDAAATIAVVGRGSEAPVGADGRFRIDGLPRGRYRLALVRPELHGLDRSYAVAEVVVEPRATAEVTVEPPPYSAVLASACGVEDWAPGNAIVMGEVLDSRTGAVAAGVTVTATWQEIEYVDFERLVLDGSERSLATRTDGSGAFRLCGVPGESTLSVSVDPGAGRSAVERRVVIRQEPVVRMVIEVPASWSRPSRSSQAALEGGSGAT